MAHTSAWRHLGPLLTLVLVAATACREDPARPEAEGDRSEPRAEDADAPDVSASASGPRALGPLQIAIEPRSGVALTGIATLEEMPQGVQITVELDHASDGPHAVHVHERADCSAPDASSAGDHFDPHDQRHGLPSDPEHHLGDLGNVQVRGGSGTLTVLAQGATLRPDDESSFLGRAIVVHAHRDSGAEPDGDAGDRIGCAEIPAADRVAACERASMRLAAREHLE